MNYLLYAFSAGKILSQVIPPGAAGILAYLHTVFSAWTLLLSPCDSAELLPHRADTVPLPCGVAISLWPHT